MAVDYFLKLDGIAGESEDSNHKGWITLHSFSWGGQQITSVGHTGGSGAGKADLADFSVTKNLDKATTPTFKAMVTGQHIKTASLEAVKAGSSGKPFLKIDMKEIFVTTQHITATNEIPTESVSFSYNEIKSEYSTQNDQGVVTVTGSVTFNTAQNKAS
jgi:type VI secretion system secreted protein Hcp